MLLIIIINLEPLKAKLRRLKMLEKREEEIFQCQQPNQERRQEIKELYLCSCGKDYRSFAAVYLHVRIKHGIKLSTTPIEHRKRIIVQNNIRKIYYDVNDESKEKNSPDSTTFHRTRAKNGKKVTQQSLNGLLASQWISNIQQCFDKYLREFPNKPKHLYQKLKIFLAFEFESTHKRIPIKKIPQHLNDFVQRFLPACDDPIKKETQKWSETCSELFYFSNWLRQQRYTQYYVLFESGPFQS